MDFEASISGAIGITGQLTSLEQRRLWLKAPKLLHGVGLCCRDIIFSLYREANDAAIVFILEVVNLSADTWKVFNAD